MRYFITVMAGGFWIFYEPSNVDIAVCSTNIMNINRQVSALFV